MLLLFHVQVSQRMLRLEAFDDTAGRLSFRNTMFTCAGSTPIGSPCSTAVVYNSAGLVSELTKALAPPPNVGLPQVLSIVLNSSFYNLGNPGDAVLPITKAVTIQTRKHTFSLSILCACFWVVPLYSQCVFVFFCLLVFLPDESWLVPPPRLPTHADAPGTSNSC